MYCTGQRIFLAIIHVFRFSRYQLQLALLTLSLFLTACSGDTSSTSENANNPGAASAANRVLAEPVDFYLFDDIALKAGSQYRGETAEKGFPSNESASTAITNSLFGAFANQEDIKRYPGYHYHWLGMPWTALTTEIPLLDVNAKRRNMPGNTTYQCDPENANAGEATVSRKAANLENREEAFWYTFEYRNCKEKNRNVRYTGTVQALFIREGNETINFLLVAYDNVTLLKAGRTFNVTGAMKVLDPIACGPEGDRIHYLSVTDASTGNSVFLENFILGRYDRSDRSCDGYASDTNYFEGKLYNSEYGAIHVSTVEPLGHNIDSHPKYQPYTPESADTSSTAGEVQISSADDMISVGLTHSMFAPVDSSSQLSVNAAQISFTGENFSEPRALQYNRELFQWGAFLDLADDDEDGMNNSWETLVELNNQNAADADSDVDEDSRPALVEFETGGDPVLSGVKGSTVDRRIDIEITHTKFYHGTIAINFTTYTDNYDSGYGESETILYFDSPGDWEGVDQHCSVNADNQLVCQSRSYQSGVSFRPRQDGPVTLYSAMSETEYDINSSNNSQSFDVDFAATQVDHEMVVASESVSPSFGEHTIRARVTKRFPVTSYEPAVEIAIPSGVTISSAKAGLDGRASYSNCDIADNIVCSVPTMRLGQTLDLEISFTMVASEAVQFRWTVVAYPYELELGNNIATTTVSKAQSAYSVLKPLVDAAPDGGTVLLPPGNYDGRIDAGGKTLTIAGSGNANPTRLHTFRDTQSSLSDFGDQTVIRNIEFIGPGAPIVFNTGDQLTVTENHFSPSAADGEITGLLVSPVYANWSETRARDASYRFINNEVTGFGTAWGSQCDQLLSATEFRASLIEGNTFSDINCENGMIAGGNLFDRSYTDFALTNFSNNTVSNVAAVFNFNYDASSSFQHTSNIYNNIFHNTDRMLNADAVSMLSSDVNSLNTFNNIVYSTQSPNYAQHIMTNDVTTIWADPLLLNPAAHQYSLQSGSPAIDQSKVFPNSSLAEFEASLFNYYPDRVVIIDGNGDGNYAADIGATEFSP